MADINIQLKDGLGNNLIPVGGGGAEHLYMHNVETSASGSFKVLVMAITTSATPLTSISALEPYFPRTSSRVNPAVGYYVEDSIYYSVYGFYISGTSLFYTMFNEAGSTQTKSKTSANIYDQVVQIF